MTNNLKKITTKLITFLLLIVVSIILSGCSNPLQKEEPESIYLEDQIQGIEDYKSGSLTIGKTSYKIVSSLSEIKGIDNDRYLIIHLFSEAKTCGDFSSNLPLLEIRLPENIGQPNTFDQEHGEMIFQNIDIIVNRHFSQRIENSNTDIEVITLIPPEKDDVIEVSMSNSDTIPRQLTTNGEANIEMKIEINLGSTLCSVDQIRTS